jgi:hypothetical protein
MILSTSIGSKETASVPGDAQHPMQLRLHLVVSEMNNVGGKTSPLRSRFLNALMAMAPLNPAFIISFFSALLSSSFNNRRMNLIII